MTERLNYARHTGDRKRRVKGTGATVLFRGSPPVPENEWHEWSFWAVPTGVHGDSFQGKLVAEDSDRRCIRLQHKPKSCSRCQGAVWQKVSKEVEE